MKIIRNISGKEFYDGNQTEFSFVKNCIPFIYFTVLGDSL